MEWFCMTSKRVLYCVLVVVLAAMFCAGSTVAETTNDRAVQSGADVFVYESIRVMDAENNQISTENSKLTKLSGDTTPDIIHQISADANGNFTLYEETVYNHYGVYYLADTPGAVTDATPFVNIWYPEISIYGEFTTGENGETQGDSIDGKTIDKDTNVTFLINAPKTGPAGIGATAKIVFTTPNGGKTTTFGTKTFEMIHLTTAQTRAGWTAAGDDAVSGTYTAQAEYTAPQYFVDCARKSNTISFTVNREPLVITAAKDSVVRGNPFTVTINGKADSDFAVFIVGYDSSEGNIPTLVPNQDGYVGGDCTTQNGLLAGATFKMDAAGVRTIQFNTTLETKADTYSIRVEEAGDATNNDYVKVKVERGSISISVSGDGTYEYRDTIGFTGTNTDSDTVYLFITGPNLLTDGISLRHLPTQLAAKDNNQPITVDTDNTWGYRWNITESGLDSGAYTIYATSKLTNGKSSSPAGDAVNLSDAEYATASICIIESRVAVSAHGTWPYHPGDEIELRGTNTASGEIYLFLTGPGLDVKGVSLTNLQTPAYQNDQPLTVSDDDSWEYTWNTAGLGLTAGKYTIYATSKLTNGISPEGESPAVGLAEAKYATTTINFIGDRDGGVLTATPSVDTVARGDSFCIRGSTTTQTDTLKLYIFGPNVFQPYTVSVKEDGSYEQVIEADITWPSSQYYVVIEHPMTDGQYDAELRAVDTNGQEVAGAIWPNDYNQWFFTNDNLEQNSQMSFIVWGANKLQGSNAADALIALLDGESGDDICTPLSFKVTHPRLIITEPGEQIVGTPVTISGTTNLAVGDQLVVTVYSASLTGEPVWSKTDVAVTAGEDSTNIWSTVLDTTGWQPDTYVINVERSQNDVRESASLSLINSGSEELTIIATPKKACLGETILLHGNNRLSKNVYLFIVGPDISGDGIILQSLPERINAAEAADPVVVSTDQTWHYNFDTKHCGLSPGTYTIYAADRLTNGMSAVANGQAVALKDANYTIATITLDPPTGEDTGITCEPAHILPSEGDLYVGEVVSATVRIFIPANSDISRIDLHSDLTGAAYTGKLTDRSGIPITEFPVGRPYIDGYALSGFPRDTILTISMNGYVPQNRAGSEISVFGFDIQKWADPTYILLLHYASPLQQVLDDGTRNITVTVSPSLLLSNDMTTISGTTTGSPAEVKLYVFGQNKYLIESVAVAEDGTYRKEITIDDSWVSDHYYILVEHPGENAKIDVEYNEAAGTLSAGDPQGSYSSFFIDGSSKLQGVHAFSALGKMIEAAGIDDTYAITEFQVTKDDPVTPDEDTIPESNGDTITITASKSTISLGESVTFRGLTTQEEDVYIFMTGPNLLKTGILLPGTDNAGFIAADKASSPTTVRTGKAWSYLWDTSYSGLDTGTYTIYATDRLTNGTSSIAGENAAALCDANYTSMQITLKDSSLSLCISPSIVAKGDKIRFSGVATGDPRDVMLYIFGPNYFASHTIPVTNEDTYDMKIPIGNDWSSNQYFVVVHHPKYNDKYDVRIAYLNGDTDRWQSTEPANSQKTIFYLPPYMYSGQEIPEDKVNEMVTTAAASIIVEGANKLQGSIAAEALSKMIDSANIDDTYVKQSFAVVEPWIDIKHPGTQTVGSVFTLEGKTNIAAGHKMLVEVMPMSGNPLDKFDTWAESGVIIDTPVIPGSTEYNVWSVEVDTTGWTPDKYIIRVSCINIDAADEEEFLLTAITPTNLKIVEGPLSVTAGDTVVYKASATNANYYKWYLDGAEIAGQTGSSVRITFPETAMGKKVVKVTASYDGNTYIGPATRTVQVAEPAGTLGEIGELTTNPANPVVGEVTTFTIPAVTNAVKYTWAFTGGKTYTTTAPATHHILPDATGQSLTLTAYNSAGETKSKTFAISDIGVKPTITLSPPVTSASVGYTTTFTASGATGTFTWYLDGEKQEGSTGNTFTTKPWDYDEAGTHTVSVTFENEYGTATAVGTVTVNAGDGGRLIKKIVGKQMVKIGDVQKYHVLVVHPNDEHDISWELDGNEVGTNSKFYEFSPENEDSGTQHTLKVTVTKDGREDSEEILITVIDGTVTKATEPETKTPPSESNSVTPNLAINDSKKNPLEYVSQIILNTSDLNEDGNEVYVNLTIPDVEDIPPFTDDMGDKKDNLLTIEIEPNGLKNEKDLDTYALLTIRLPKTDVGNDPSLVSFYRYNTGTDKNAWEWLTLQRAPLLEKEGFYLFTVQTGGMSTFTAIYGQERSIPTDPITPPSTIPDSSPSVSSSGGNMNNAFRVLFDTAGGNSISPATDLSYGDTVAKPAEPTRNGYTFGGWYTDTACLNAWNFNNPISGDMTLYAKWIATGSSDSVPTAEPTTDHTTPSTKPTEIRTPVSTPATPAETTATNPPLTQAPVPLAGLLIGLGAAALLCRRRE